VVLKQSSNTLLCANRFADAFKEAGLPEGVFQVRPLAQALTHIHTLTYTPLPLPPS
jgi:acyl-CoA reductase-like NAD-dependent aldehyde dehydrogenase